MTKPTLTPWLAITQIIADGQESLNLQWQCGADGQRYLMMTPEDHYSTDVIGHFNIIHPARIHVIGPIEYRYLSRLGTNRTLHLLEELYEADLPALIFANGLTAPTAIQKFCSDRVIPLLTTSESCSKVIETFRAYFNRLLARRETRHGVLMDVLGLGVLITGDSGVGKSELALELISRGHGLVADDSVEIYEIAPGIIEGRCPELLTGFLEVRGLGLLDIRTIFGETAVRRKHRIRLIVQLVKPEKSVDLVRIPLDRQEQALLDTKLPLVTIPVASGRNISVLIEAAVRNAILQLRGIDSNLEFMRKQSASIAANRTAITTPDDTGI